MASSLQPSHPRRLLLALLLCLLLLCSGVRSVAAADDMYCGSADCYHVLGVAPDSSPSAVKRAYYKLALELHPDKNPDPLVVERYQAVTNAYEVLSDPDSRQAYDDLLANPEAVWRHRMRYYQHKQKQIGLTAILLPLFLLTSVLHIVFWRYRYHKLRSQLRQAPQLQAQMRARVKAALTEEKIRAGVKASAVALTRGEIEARMEQEDVSDYVRNLDWSGRLPTWRDTLPIWLALAPFRLVRGLWWHAKYQWHYSVLRRAYDPASDDADYATRVALELPVNRWAAVEDAQRAELVAQQLWIPKNLEAFQRKSMVRKKKTW
jgi:hypothetical protein